MTTLLINDIQNCTKCPLYAAMPLGCKPVPGIGPPSAKLMIVGEALGEDESIIGKPFQGACGRLLNNMLRDADIRRENVFITNTVKCRPTVTKGKKLSNRPPSKKEITTCKGWLFEEIMEVRPEVIFTLGRVPTSILLNLKSVFTLSDMVGKEYQDSLVRIIDGPIYKWKVVPLYHPSYVMVHSRSDYKTCVDIFSKYKDLT